MAHKGFISVNRLTIQLLSLDDIKIEWLIYIIWNLILII